PARACDDEQHVLGAVVDVLGEVGARLIAGVVDGEVVGTNLPGHDGVREHAPDCEWLPVAVHVEDRRHGRPLYHAGLTGSAVMRWSWLQLARGSPARQRVPTMLPGGRAARSHVHAVPAGDSRSRPD